MAAGLTSLAMPIVGRSVSNDVARPILGALIGGTVSAATGGKFANGALSGALQMIMMGGQQLHDTGGGGAPADPKIAAIASVEAEQALADAGIYRNVEEGKYRSGRALARDWGKAVYPVAKRYGVELGIRIYRGRYGQYVLGPTGSSGAADWVSVPALPKLKQANYRWTGVAHTHPPVSNGHRLSVDGVAYRGTRDDGTFFIDAGSEGDLAWAAYNQKSIYVYGGANASFTSWSFREFAASHALPGQMSYLCATTSPPQC